MTGTRIFACAAALVCAGCSDTPPAPSPTNLTGRTWVLSRVEQNGQLVSVPSPDRYSIRFDGTDRVAVRSDCNSCSGSYSAAGDVLRLAALACTRAYCGSTSFDGEFTELLGQSLSIELSENTLVLRSAGATLRFGTQP